VEESSILDTMHFLWTRMKIVVEPSGAVALAALFERVVSAEGLRVGVIVSGGNVDLDAACGLLSGR
jgi:threonine dehydratase